MNTINICRWLSGEWLHVCRKEDAPHLPELDFYDEARVHLLHWWASAFPNARPVTVQIYRIVFGEDKDVEVAYLTLDPRPTIKPTQDPEESNQ